MSLIGGIQPEVITKALSGLIRRRLLAAELLIVLRPAVMGKDEPTPAVATSYAKLIERLTEMPPPREGFTNTTVPLCFDAGAQALGKSLERKHLGLMRVRNAQQETGVATSANTMACSGGSACCGTASSMPAKALPPVVTEATARRVAEFMHRFLLPHALAFYSRRARPGRRARPARRGRRVHTGAQAREGDQPRRPARRRHHAKADPAGHRGDVRAAEALGWVTRTQGPRSTHWTVNPRAHVRYAARASEEAERRATGRELIANVLRGGNDPDAHQP